jgi:hypothetical protein
MILDKFTIQTQDSVAIACDKLARQIDDKPSPFEINSNRVRLCGEVSEDIFRLYRIKGGGLPMSTINGWFEAVGSGIVVHLEVKLNLNLIVVYLLFSFNIICIAFNDRKYVDGEPGLSIGIIIILTIFSIYSCQDEIRFYRKKLPQIFS